MLRRKSELKSDKALFHLAFLVLEKRTRSDYRGRG
jgi:hypothetical protein